MTFVLQSFALQSYCIRDAQTLQELVGFQGSAYLNALKYSAKTAPLVFESLVASCYFKGVSGRQSSLGRCKKVHQMYSKFILFLTDVSIKVYLLKFILSLV